MYLHNALCQYYILIKWRLHHFKYSQWYILPMKQSSVHSKMSKCKTVITARTRETSGSHPSYSGVALPEPSHIAKSKPWKTKMHIIHAHCGGCKTAFWEKELTKTTKSASPNNIRPLSNTLPLLYHSADIFIISCSKNWLAYIAQEW